MVLAVFSARLTKTKGRRSGFFNSIYRSPTRPSYFATRAVFQEPYWMTDMIWLRKCCFFTQALRVL